VKYGLYGAVLAGLVGGTVAWTTVDKTVHLVVDGQRSDVHTTAGSVGGVLADAGYHPGSHDIVAPGTNADVHNGSTIVYKRGGLLELNVDGAHKSIWTTAPNVEAALSQLGYSTQDVLSVSRAQRLPLSPTAIAIRTPKVITVVQSGKPRTVTTTDATVGTLLTDLAVAVDGDDRVRPAATTPLTDGLKIVVQRVTKRTVTHTGKVPFATKKSRDSALPSGQTEVVTVGRDGLAKVTYAVVYVDGKLAGRTKIKTVLVRAPRTQVEKVGTKKVAYSSSGGSGAGASPSQAQAIARGMAADRGWTGAQFDCLVTMWNHESGWRVHASNPSGAYGIPQALPGSKMGAGWQDDASVQIAWGLGYIASRYGTPCDAWSIWQSQGWY
jgi:uncharacterized protein YabE (DUF348 family)